MDFFQRISVKGTLRHMGALKRTQSSLMSNTTHGENRNYLKDESCIPPQGCRDLHLFVYFNFIPAIRCRSFSFSLLFLALEPKKKTKTILVEIFFKNDPSN